MKISLFGFLMVPMLFYSVLTRAQQSQILNDNQGRPVMEQNYTDVEGSPYLTANWFPGTVNLSSGKAITAKLKYDLVKDELLFQSPRDSMALVFVTPVKSFSFGMFGVDETNLVPLIFNNGYPNIDDQTQASFYQVIADGKVSLLKRYKKVIHSDQVFNSATTTKTFAMRDAVYYLLANGKIEKFKPSQKAAISAMNDNADKVQAFIKNSKIDFKSDKDLARLFIYYNSF